MSGQITKEEMRFLDMAKIRKIPDTNLVEVTFHGSPSFVIARKHLVLKLERLAERISPVEHPTIREQITYTAQQCRRQL